MIKDCLLKILCLTLSQRQGPSPVLDDNRQTSLPGWWVEPCHGHLSFVSEDRPGCLVSSNKETISSEKHSGPRTTHWEWHSSSQWFQKEPLERRGVPFRKTSWKGLKGVPFNYRDTGTQFIKKGAKKSQDLPQGAIRVHFMMGMFAKGHFMGLVSHPNQVSYLEPTPDIDLDFAPGVGSDLWHIIEIKAEVRNKSKE